MKRKNYLTILLFAAACASTSILCSCGDDEPEIIVNPPQPVQLVTKIELSDATLNLQPGEKKQLTATVLPSNANTAAITWKSSDEKVASVAGGLVTAIASGACTVTCSATDGSGIYAECTVNVEKGETTEALDHEYVDLDLPSGTLWATCNIGASNPEGYGAYFAWGETQPKENYSSSTYKWCNGSIDKLTKYSPVSDFGNDGFTDTLMELLPEDDAATANWGLNWKIPSEAQFTELYAVENTTSSWKRINGIEGRLITSNRNGKTLFLPAAGSIIDTSITGLGSEGCYWSCMVVATNLPFGRGTAFGMGFRMDNNYLIYASRSTGYSVRPVRKK